MDKVVSGGLKSESCRFGELADIDAKALVGLVSSLEKLEALHGKIGTFAFLNFTTRTKNAEAGAFLQQVREFSSDVGRETVFFELG